MRNPLVIGIDMGTSGARAVAMSPDLKIHAMGTAKLSVFSDDHRDPAGWRMAMYSALHQVLSRVKRTRVIALSIDATSGTMLPIDRQGRPLAEPMMYNDPVTDSGILDAIAARAPKESAAHGATSGLAKLMTFQKLGGIYKIIHQADWLAGYFTGRFDLSDENNALKTGYDPVARRWPDWIAAAGANVNLLPEVLPAGAPMAAVSYPTAIGMELRKQLLVVAGTTDGCASFLATGADRPGDGVTALGTTMTVKLLSEQPLFAPQYGLYSHRIGDTWLAGGASNTGGAVLAQYFSPERIAELSMRIDPSTRTGLDYYPLVKPGERFPIADPALPPRLEPRPADDVEFLKALFEGIAGIESLAYQRLAQLGGPALRSVRTVGGGAANRTWSKIREKQLDVPFGCVASEEAAVGAARLALIGAKQAGLL